MRTILKHLGTQLIRTSNPFPKIRLKQKHERIEDYSLDDIEWIEPYISHNAIKMELSA